MTATIAHVVVKTCADCGRTGTKQFQAYRLAEFRCSNRRACRMRTDPEPAAPPPPPPPVLMHLAHEGAAACRGRVGMMHPDPAEVTCVDCQRRAAALILLGGLLR